MYKTRDKYRKMFNVYQLDPYDHSRVICFWKNIHDFTYYLKPLLGEIEMFWCFAHDYHRVHGKTIDKKHAGSTHDQRFCNKWYRGDIHQYDPDGEYVKTMTVAEFQAIGGTIIDIGTHQKGYGHPKLSGWDIVMMSSQMGYFWSWVKEPRVKTIICSEEAREAIGEDLYQGLRTGRYHRYNKERTYIRDTPLTQNI